jgi:plasmid stabilization system protein ParE
MSLPLIITEEAEQDIADAKKWYDRQRPGLGEEFVLCVEEALDRIRVIPEGATEVLPGVRRVVVRRFPYGVFYRVDPDQIAVLAVYHSRRDPRGWQARVDT